MCYINSQLPEFKVNAYRKDKGFIQVSNEDLKGKWSILFFYPGDFTFVCPTELADLADHYAEFQALGVDIITPSAPTLTSSTRHGLTLLRRSARSSTRCSLT